jgi:hypothetical protein
MNMFGFTPDYFKHSDEFFIRFLRENATELKAEFYVALVIDYLIKNHLSTMRVLPTSAVWFGVTYKEDRPMVVERLRELAASGEYPEHLWK